MQDLPLTIHRPDGSESAVGQPGELLAYPTLLPAPVLCARCGDEQLGLRADQAHETRITYKDGTTALFYAIISQLRGEKDFQIWERSMSSNALGVEYIEFNR